MYACVWGGGGGRSYFSLLVSSSLPIKQHVDRKELKYDPFGSKTSVIDCVYVCMCVCLTQT